MVHGTLHVTIGECRKLKNMDILGKMDPYIRIRVGDQKIRTKTRKSAGRSPVFNESFAFDISPSADPIVSFVVMDADIIGKDDFVGKLQYNFGVMASQGRTIDGWYVLERKNSKPAGEIQIKLSFEPIAASKPAFSPYSEAPQSFQPMAASEPALGGKNSKPAGEIQIKLSFEPIAASKPAFSPYSEAPQSFQPMAASEPAFSPYSEAPYPSEYHPSAPLKHKWHLSLPPEVLPELIGKGFELLGELIVGALSGLDS
eukprot:CAMPEP_0184371152 /NCGR_PEP_ID=MMETSP1089-20130417/163233_1 /TAXON_ID=38269 ORGANISM="Gloeochaete wittrockiana, Strain SAG46.84" /NCGR_SAMPLE_ID=MMETSP1089 /ASSEMBLY_ACC=CAM_ASM_000445 /LENGTH=256 /DNA_ID=CAMNT_0026713865 /DNA_START=217 /DNA_END=988 /DNA_ORIENTATION=-